MPHVVYALFEDAEAAEQIRAELSRVGKGGPGLDVRQHERRLDANQLPEGATSFGRNLVIMTALSSAFFMIAGFVLGLYDVVVGMGPGMGLAIGLITGVVIGVFTAMQAGTRVAKAPLLELAPRLPAGAVLLTIEVESRHEADQIVDDLDERGADSVGVC